MEMIHMSVVVVVASASGDRDSPRQKFPCRDKHEHPRKSASGSSSKMRGRTPTAALKRMNRLWPYSVCLSFACSFLTAFCTWKACNPRCEEFPHSMSTSRWLAPTIASVVFSDGRNRRDWRRMVSTPSPCISTCTCCISLLGTSASLLVTSALLVVTSSY